MRKRYGFYVCNFSVEICVMVLRCNDTVMPSVKRSQPLVWVGVNSDVARSVGEGAEDYIPSAVGASCINLVHFLAFSIATNPSGKESIIKCERRISHFPAQ